MEYFKVFDIENAKDYFIKCGYDLNYILRINKIDMLCRGDYLLLAKQEGKLYVVKPFDTFEKIANEFGVTVEHIKKQNDIDTILPFITLSI